MTGTLKPKALRRVELPSRLYHGSSYQHEQLMPGFQRSGSRKVFGDGVETNHYLYVTMDAAVAVYYGLVGALQRHFTLLEAVDTAQGKHFQLAEKITPEEIAQLPVWLYEISPYMKHCWSRNQDLTSERMYRQFRTRRTVPVARVERVNIGSFLAASHITVKGS